MDEQTRKYADSDWLTRLFEVHRPHMERVAYRMLGSITDRDDALQETRRRFARTDAAAVDNLGGWLTTVVGGVCLDKLRARNSLHEHSEQAARENACATFGSWVPEPSVAIDDPPTPAEETLVVDSVGLALLVVLETLAPNERIAFVLHDMFRVPFNEIAQIIGRSPTAIRQQASNARRRVRGAPLNEAVDLSAQRELIDAFLAASRAGDFDGLVAVLDPSVVFRVDAGPGGSSRARGPIEGAKAVAQRVLESGRPLAHLARPALVNGEAGLVVGRPGRTIAVVSFTATNHRIVTIDLITDRNKLRRVDATT